MAKIINLVEVILILEVGEIIVEAVEINLALPIIMI